MPILFYDTKESVPSDVVEDATEVKEGENKGKWTVNLVSRKKLEAFRENNTSLASDKEKLAGIVSTVFGTLGVKPEEFDPEKLKEELTGLRDTARKVADGKLQASDEIDNLLTKRTEAMRSKFEQSAQETAIRLAQANKKAEEAEFRYRRTFIDREVSRVVANPDLGVEGTALLDVVAKAYQVFEVQEDTSLVPKAGGNTIWGEDGATPMTVEEWVNTRLRKEAPHYFKRSTGGGAGGGGDPSLGGFSKEDFSKLPADQRLALANQNTTGKKK